MSGEKRFAATATKLQRAASRGERPHSEVLVQAAVLLVAALGLALGGVSLLHATRRCWSAALVAVATPNDAQPLLVMRTCAAQVAVVGVPTCVGALVAVLLGYGAQGGWRRRHRSVAGEGWSHRTALAAGLRGMGSLLAQRGVRLGVFLVVVVVTVLEDLRSLLMLGQYPIEVVAAALVELPLRLLTRLSIAWAGLAVADWCYQRWRFHHAQRMSVVELRREQRDQIGDPLLRQRRTAERRRSNS